MLVSCSSAVVRLFIKDSTSLDKEYRPTLLSLSKVYCLLLLRVKYLKRDIRTFKVIGIEVLSVMLTLQF